MENDTIRNKICGGLSSIFSACPYTLAGKKIVKMVKSEKKVSGSEINTEGFSANQIIMGRNIALIGFFCPIFWISLFSGANLRVIGMNAVHSGIVILIGLAMMGMGKWALANTRASELRRKINKVRAQKSSDFSKGGIDL